MSKLTDKIEALRKQVKTGGADDIALIQILADVWELEQELRIASLKYESAIDVLHSSDAIRAAKREAYEHARDLMVNGRLAGVDTLDIDRKIRGAIDALDTEGNSDE